MHTTSYNYEHHAPTLNAQIIGVCDSEADLVMFRGVPYATVSERWTHSKVKDSLDVNFDATSYGPRCVQPEGPVLVSGGVNDPVPGDDEFACLNLNIAVPKNALRGAGTSNEFNPLAVMVWIHGGAFMYGANSVARYRPERLLSIAAAAGTPIILVQVGYRLGVLGFAASENLSEEALSNGSPSCVGNYGLVDQRNALLWVQRHISSFGGNPSNVTAFGVSAGSASVHHHITSSAGALFDRAILMSGSAPTLGPLPFRFYESVWQKMCSNLGISEKDDLASNMKILRQHTPEEIVAAYPKGALGPVEDGVLFKPGWKFEDHPKNSRCKEIILGDTRVECIILDGMFQTVPQSVFQSEVHSAFSQSDADALLQYFGFASDEMDFGKYQDAMRFFFSVVMFQYPNLAIARSVPGTYLYHFEEASPYPGPTEGLAYHGQCALFVHGNESVGHPECCQLVSLDMAQRFTAFANGIEPWEPYSTSRFMRFGPAGKSEMKSLKTDVMRDYGYIQWLERNFEQVKQFAQRFLNESR